MEQIGKQVKSLMHNLRLDAISACLNLLIQERRFTTYEALARSIALEAGSEEFRLLLSETMFADHAHKRPFRCALILSSSKVPGDKFFRQAETLRKIEISDQRAFWSEEVNKLFSLETKHEKD